MKTESPAPHLTSFDRRPSLKSKILEADSGVPEQLTLTLTGTAPSLIYPGKVGVRALLGRLRPRAQRCLPTYSAGSDEGRADNLVIEGDNLQAMASLYRYRGQVDLIVADPPYNSGRDFRYNDRWDVDLNDPNPGEFVSKEDDGKHSKWMRFMHPRLEMMKAMLKPGGVCAVCIDDRELFRLGMMMDECFGETNRLGVINWQKSYSPKNDSSHLSKATEYVLVYARRKERAKTALLERTARMNSRYTTEDGDPHAWAGDNLAAKRHDKPEDYGIQSPFTGEIHYPAGTGRWRMERAQIKTALEAWGSAYVSMDDPDCTLKSLVLKGTKNVKGRLQTPKETLHKAREKAIKVRDNEIWPVVYFLKKGTGRPRNKRYLKDVKQGRVPLTYWADEEYQNPLVLESQSWLHQESGHSQTGIDELTAIVGPKHGFETVKPLRLIEKIIQLWCPANGIVLDPFAGSGTTGHAVLDLNAETETSRRFILIEQSRPDRGDPYARTLTAERLKRVVTGNWAAGKQPPLGSGFTFSTSTTQVDRGAVLAMQREELVDLILLSHWDTKNRKGPMLNTLVHKAYKHLVARDDSRSGFFLVWEGPSSRSVLTVSILGAIIGEAKKEALRAPYHVYARTSLVVSPEVVFYQIPDEILAKIGFDDSVVVEDES